MKMRKLINNLKKVKNNNKVENRVGKLFFEVLEVMATKQVNDTGQSRALIIKSFAKHFNISIDATIKKSYDWWASRGYPGNAFRGWDVSDNMSFKDYKEGFKAKIKINDYGVYNQEMNVDGWKPAEGVGNPTRDNSGFEPRHITATIDEYNRGDFKKYEDEILTIIKNIIIKI